MFMNVAKQSLAEAMGVGDSTPEPPEMTAACKAATANMEHIEAVLSAVEKPMPEKLHCACNMFGYEHLASSLTDYGEYLISVHDDFSGKFCNTLGAAQRELLLRRKRFDEEIREKFVRPELETSGRDQKRLTTARHQSERYRKNYDGLRGKAQAIAREKAPDGQKLLACQEEMYIAGADYDTARLGALYEAQDVVHRKEFTFLANLRSLMAAQLQHYRECAAVLEGLEPQLRAAEEHCREQSAQYEEVQRARAKMAAVRTEDTRASRFEPFIELISSPKLELLAALLDVVPQASKDQVTASFARMLDAERKALPIVKTAISQTVAETDNPLMLFRANTTAIRLMSVYTKTLSAEHVRQTLAEPIGYVCDNRPEQYEIDANLLPAGSQELAMQNAQNLARAIDRFVESIVGNLAGCPLPVREISRHLMEEVSRKQNSPASGYLAVGGFMLLRLYCPNITAPASVGITESPPTGPAARALVLVAKAIQAIANDTVGAKEPFMKLLEPYVVQSRDRIRKWYDALTSVTEADIDRYAASIRRDEVRAVDLPLLEDLCRTNVKNLGKTLTSADNKMLLIRLTGVLAQLSSV